MSMSLSHNRRRGCSPYGSFDWHTMPLPHGVAAIARRPKYDDNFDVEEFMRGGNYAGPYRLPQGVTVRMHANPLPTPTGEVVTVGEFRGRRDYLEYLGMSPIQEQPCHRCRQAYDFDAGYGNVMGGQQRGTRHHYELPYHKNFPLIGTTDRHGMRARSTMRHGATASRSDTSMYHMKAVAQQNRQLTNFKMSHVSQHTAISHSSSSSDVGPVPINMFTGSAHPSWSGSSVPAPVNSGYVVAGYDANTGYAAVPSQVPSSMPEMMTAQVPVMDTQQVNAGNVQDAEMGNMGSPPVVNYQGEPVVYKPESVDYSYESAQMYPQVLTQPVFPPQHEPPVIRTAAGGECDGLIKFEEPSDYEQPFGAAGGEQYSGYGMVQDMPMDRQVQLPPVEDIYPARDNNQPYAKTSAGENTNTVSELKEDSDDDGADMAQRFFSS